MKLGNKNLKDHVFPISKIKTIESITIVRDHRGPDIEKVRYVSPFLKEDTSPLLTFSLKLYHLVRLALREKPVLIHSYKLFPHGYLAFIAGKLTGRNVGVSLIAGPVETYFFGNTPIAKYPYDRPLPQPSPTSVIRFSILKRFDVITVTGSYTKRFLVDHGVDEGKVFILPHSVDERFRVLGIEKDYDLVFVGRLASVKHIETIIRAVAFVKVSIPSIRLAIVGDGDNKSDLEALVVSLGLTHEIDFVGYQTNTWEWYNRSKISILSSEREGFPFTVIESLKCGVPVISSNCGDIRDIIMDSFNGVIISDYQDYRAFGNAIIRLLKHPDLISEYSSQGLNSVESISSASVEAVWDHMISMISKENTK